MRVGRNRDLPRYATEIGHLCRGSAVGYRLYVNIFGFGGYGIGVLLLHRETLLWSRMPPEEISLRCEYSWNTAMDERRPK